MKTKKGIYQIVHKRTGWIYIGSSINLPSREKSFLNGNWVSWSFWFRFRFGKKPIKTNHFYWAVLEYMPKNYPVKRLREREYKWIGLIPKEYSLNIKRKMLKSA